MLNMRWLSFSKQTWRPRLQQKKEIENYFDILSQTERCNKLNNWREKNSQKQQTNNLIIVTRVSESMIETTDISFRSIIQSK